MNIYESGPADWRDLQLKVSEILTTIGFDCTIEKDIETVRGTVNVDVFAIDKKSIPQNNLICECKYWTSAIPKTIIHAFRSTISDFGANYGIIISRNGFQSGSYEAAKNTNVILLSWEEFQNYFLQRWILSKTKQISIITRPLYNYISAGFSVFFKSEFNQLTADESEVFKNLNYEYFHYAFHASNLDYKDLNTHEFDFKFYEELLKQAEKVFEKKFTSYLEYYAYLQDKCEEGANRFDILFGKKLRLSSDFKRIDL